MRNFLFLLLMSQLLVGCVTLPTDIEPKEMASNGIMSLRVSGISATSVKINGNYYPGEHMFNGFVSLPPGDYKLEAVLSREYAGGGSYSGAYASSSYTRYKTTTYPVERTFTIERGKVTSLGEVFVLNKSKGRYATWWLKEIGTQMAQFHERYPEVYPVLKDPTPKIQGDIFISKKDYSKLQQKIASQVLRDERTKGGMAGWANTQGIVKGQKGAVMYYQNNAQGKLKLSVTLPTSVNDPIRDCDWNGAFGACLIQGNRIYHYDARGKRTELKLPVEEFDARYIITFGKQGIYLVSPLLALYKSTDMGESWQSIPDYAVEPGLISLTGKFQRGLTADYLLQFDEGVKERTFAINHKTGAITKIPTQDEFELFRDVIELDNHILLRGDSGVSLKGDPIYILEKKTGKWITRALPKASCQAWASLDRKGKQVWSGCGADHYMSKDLLTSWEEY